MLSRAFLYLLVLAVLSCAQVSAAMPDMAIDYAPDAPLEALKAYNVVVVDPDHGFDPKAYRSPGSTLFAYVGVGEVRPERAYARDIPAAWQIGRNAAWQSLIVDQSAAGWPDFFAEHVIAPLWDRGYRGFFLDTLDSYRLVPKADPAAQQAGLVQVVRTLTARFPGIKLIFNRGFEILPQVRDAIYAVAAESLFRGWDAAAHRYVEVADADRQWLLGELTKVRDELGKPVVVIDYVPPQDRALARATAARISRLGFIPWVTDADLDQVGVGRLELVPRRIMVVYDSKEAPALNFTDAHRYLQMPLNYLGYVVDYVDVRQPLPKRVSPALYAGVVTWLTGGTQNAAAQRLDRWLQARIEEGTRVAIVGQFGFDPPPAFLAAAGLARQAAADGPLKITTQAPMLGFEMKPLPMERQLVPLRVAASGGQPLLSMVDDAGHHYDAAALMPWGGFVLDPFAVLELPGVDDQMRWIIDPFAFLRAALALPPLPVPDTTTENGRRLLFAHVDGDGFPSFAEFPGRPLGAEVLYKEIFTRYRIPTAVSVIEMEVAPHGRYPQLSPRMEAVARKIFALPQVEVASHTYTHPFYWNALAKGKYKAAEQGYDLAPPGYVPDLQREIAGSSEYIDRNLAPPDKPVDLLLWSGDAAPTAAALKVAREAGLLNMNGGATTIGRRDPSVTAVSALGIRHGGYFQAYAPEMNEDVYTNLWTGPFYGFQDVIDTYRMTDAPRRLKPIDIYYHIYSGTKRASLAALRKVYDWALAQPVYPIFPREYIEKAFNFYDIALARDVTDGSLEVRNADALRTLRAPLSLGYPDPAASTGVAGFEDGVDGRYISLSADSAVLRFSANSPAGPLLVDANARLMAWQREAGTTKLQLSGHVPLHFSLRLPTGCAVRNHGRPLKPARTEGPIQSFRLPDAAATLTLSCS